MVWVCIRALAQTYLHSCDGSINAEKFVEILEQHVLSSKWHLFPGMSKCFLTRRCKTTFCTKYKGMAAKEEVTENNGSYVLLYTLINVCRINGTK